MKTYDGNFNFKGLEAYPDRQGNYLTFSNTQEVADNANANELDGIEFIIF